MNAPSCLFADGLVALREGGPERLAACVPAFFDDGALTDQDTKMCAVFSDPGRGTQWCDVNPKRLCRVDELRVAFDAFFDWYDYVPTDVATALLDSLTNALKNKETADFVRNPRSAIEVQLDRRPDLDKQVAAVGARLTARASAEFAPPGARDKALLRTKHPNHSLYYAVKDVAKRKLDQFGQLPIHFIEMGAWQTLWWRVSARSDAVRATVPMHLISDVDDFVRAVKRERAIGDVVVDALTLDVVVGVPPNTDPDVTKLAFELAFNKYRLSELCTVSADATFFRADKGQLVGTFVVDGDELLTGQLAKTVAQAVRAVGRPRVTKNADGVTTVQLTLQQIADDDYPAIAVKVADIALVATAHCTFDKKVAQPSPKGPNVAAMVQTIEQQEAKKQKVDTTPQQTVSPQTLQKPSDQKKPASTPPVAPATPSAQPLAKVAADPSLKPVPPKETKPSDQKEPASTPPVAPATQSAQPPQNPVAPVTSVRVTRSMTIAPNTVQPNATAPLTPIQMPPPPEVPKK